jgi:hypothetical protein
MTFRIPTHEWDGEVKMGRDGVAYYNSADSTLPGPSSSQLQGLFNEVVNIPVL